MTSWPAGNVGMPDPLDLGALGIAFVVAAWVMIAPRRALPLLFFRQRAVRDLAPRRVRVLRGLAAVVAVSVMLLLARWGLPGVAP